jgi:hypothetical protein
MRTSEKLLVKAGVYLGAFAIGFVCHQMSVHGVIESWATKTGILITGVIQTLVTMCTIHGLGRLVRRYEDILFCERTSSKYQKRSQYFKSQRTTWYAIFWTGMFYHVLILFTDGRGPALRYSGYAQLATTFGVIAGLFFWQVLVTYGELRTRDSWDGGNRAESVA